MDTKVVNKSQVKSALKIPGLPGNIVAALTMRVAGFDRLNELYSKVSQYEGLEFIDKLMEQLEVTYSLNPDALENVPTEGKLLVVANHPLGGLDGMLALKILSQVRKDIKVLTNVFVAHLPNTKEFFLPVNTTYGYGRIIAASHTGIKQAEEHLNNGGALVVFPAGEVSENADWQGFVGRWANRIETKVLPMFFEGGQSWYYQFLQKISVKLSDWRLPNELSKNKGRNVKVRIGNYIKPTELTKFKDDKETSRYFRSRVYALESDVKLFLEEVADAKPIAPAVPTQILLDEIEKNKDCQLFRVGPYSSYLFDYEQIPNIIKEIGVKREEAFRAVGEGTGKEIDLDEYDLYYKHLILWDNDKNDMVGAYRLGMGEEIVDSKGVKGFYSNMFFRFSDKFAPVLRESVELGRSFVAVEHQKDTMGLVLLLKGLFYTMMKYKQYKHFIGPVSISSWYPMLYRSVMVYYLKRYASTPQYSAMVNPATPFVEDFGRVEPDIFLQGRMDNLEGFDRYLYRASGGKYRVPTLVKKYLKLGSKIIDYNVDPDFNDCLDCLIMLTFSDIPVDDIDSLCKEFEDHRPIYRRFYGSEL